MVIELPRYSQKSARQVTSAHQLVMSLGQRCAQERLRKKTVYSEISKRFVKDVVKKWSVTSFPFKKLLELEEGLCTLLEVIPGLAVWMNTSLYMSLLKTFRGLGNFSSW